ncbi:unnamed protein product [Phaeothamnion confervicola]
MQCFFSLYLGFTWSVASSTTSLTTIVKLGQRHFTCIFTKNGEIGKVSFRWPGGRRLSIGGHRFHHNAGLWRPGERFKAPLQASYMSPAWLCPSFTYGNILCRTLVRVVGWRCLAVCRLCDATTSEMLVGRSELHQLQDGGPFGSKLLAASKARKSSTAAGVVLRNAGP